MINNSKIALMIRFLKFLLQDRELMDTQKMKGLCLRLTLIKVLKVQETTLHLQGVLNLRDL